MSDASTPWRGDLIEGALYNRAKVAEHTEALSLIRARAESALASGTMTRDEYAAVIELTA